MEKLQTRKATIPRNSPASLNIERRTVRVTAATESPVRVYDFERFEIVDEVLIMSGLQIPAGGQVPLLDSHSRFSAKDVLGSCTNFEVKGGNLEADISFSTDQGSEAVFTKVREGHLTDVSVGYKVNKSIWVAAGESREVAGKTYRGPVKLAINWTVKEISVTPIGADGLAKVRSEAEGERSMEDKAKNQGGGSVAELSMLAERQRTMEIVELCSVANLPELSADLISRGSSVDECRKTILDRMAENRQPVGLGLSSAGAVRVGREASEKRRDAIIDGFCLRAGSRIENPAAGANEYRNVSLMDLAKECLTAAGENVRSMGPARIVELATRAHHTGDFPALLSGMANKMLRTAYEEQPSTWEKWCKITDGRDFKDMSRIALSEASDLDLVPEHGEYAYGELSENAEIFRIFTYGKMFAITRQAIINDDLGAFSRVPQMQGGSAKRRISTLVYSILTSNPLMADGVALFNAAAHFNVGTAGVIALPSISEGRQLMRTQVGLAGAVLNVAPRYLIVPASQETTADQIVTSISLDAANSGISNPFRGKLEVVVEALLDTSATPLYWYMAANPAVCDTVEVCFLNGQRVPYLEQRDGWTVDGIEFKARLDVGVKAIDHRGLVQNPRIA